MIAIHARSGSFSDKWIEYMQKFNIPYKLVNCYRSDIVCQLKGCGGLMWHWNQEDHKAALFARQLTYSLESSGIKVFPDTKTCWHYDDKVGQKYLFEALEIDTIGSYVFYCEIEAKAWLLKKMLPVVFKLRGGAGSENVILVKNISHGLKLIRKAFSSGFARKNRVHLLKERIWRFRRDKTIGSLLNISKGVGRLLIPKEAEIRLPTEKNYVYFQDYVQGSDHDIRIIVIGKRAFGIKRMVRAGDFRASGSGIINYDPKAIPEECIVKAFEYSEKMNLQCAAYDFIFCDQKPLLIEISYAFARVGYLPCKGYWTRSMEWIDGAFSPEYFMVEDFVASVIGGEVSERNRFSN